MNIKIIYVFYLFFNIKIFIQNYHYHLGDQHLKHHSIIHEYVEVYQNLFRFMEELMK